jgi:hypothetical protein
MFDHHADNAKRLTPQPKWIAVAGGLHSNTPDPRERFQLVGQCHHQTDWTHGETVPGKTGPVMILDGLSDFWRFAIVHCVITTHGALELGELANHTRDQVALG